MENPSDDYITTKMRIAAKGFLEVEPINPAQLYANSKPKKDAKPKKQKRSSPHSPQADLF